MTSFLMTLISFVVSFSILVFIHEMGHYSIARLFKIKVESFSIGFGRELFGYTAKSGTRWKFSAIPLGGYVKFAGDASVASNPSAEELERIPESERENCIHFKPVWQRALVTAAGPVINIVAAIVVFAGFYLAYDVRIAAPVVNAVTEGSPAEAAGLQVGDKILSLNGTEVERFGDIRNMIVLRPGQVVETRIERAGREMALDVTVGTAWNEDRFGNRYPYGQLGIASPATEPLEVGVFGALREACSQTYDLVGTIFTTIGQMILGIRSVTELGGPLRIADMTGAAASQGIESLVWFLALISVNLGVMNLLPIPVLDGGHLLFYAVEAVKGSPLSMKAQQASFAAGAALMLLFMVFVTLNDLHSMAL